MYIPVSSYHVFGSGSAVISLRINGTRFRGEGLRNKSSDNGFVGVVMADIPVTMLRSFREVDFYEGYSPGGTRKFKGSGNHFIKWLLGTRKWDAIDPLSKKIQKDWNKGSGYRSRLPGVQKVMDDRYQAAKEDELIARIRAGEFVLNPDKWERDREPFLYREVVTLRDGCRGWRWTGAVGIGNFCGYSGPHWKRVIEAAEALSLY